MTTDFLPACCTSLSAHWPLPHTLPSLQLYSTRFDPAQLRNEDFRRCAITPVSGIAKRQTEYLAGRLCARAALNQLTGLPAVPGSGEDRAPQWPTGTLGSITHGSGWAGAVVGNSADWRGLGLDIELIMPASRAERLAGEILTPNELASLNSLPTEQRAQRISLTFSLKESLFKALYPQVLRHFYFQDAELLSVDAENRVRMRLLIDLHTDWPAGSELEGQFTEFDGYLLSLVSIPR
ncbi:4'-phosphopantetheinyl transferase [Pseudomonas sp. HMWF032]|uniref:4'-phosphopantetheinyl transferase family protein n=1 Tax=unclassified Pseudomonas TaxID=196821 RepID=UPI000D3474E6|nr:MULTISPECIES: 4'-phosphopantetheinyl transferase superfamily protein [unclassified Pseudomonas]PTS84417.1 4'-phosphopantetheinyl transferase [Pseudomonas sp. HMWF032]PTT81227.1 4'-phosphopantetheinyl transferase [Pseudomonas sp. HMWF010]WAC44415.1 4'-phosphopantetheinyl transferase superfamily protein [Pseudomonas sp. SL4(2022)]